MTTLSSKPITYVTSSRAAVNEATANGAAEHAVHTTGEPRPAQALKLVRTKRMRTQTCAKSDLDPRKQDGSRRQQRRQQRRQLTQRGRAQPPKKADYDKNPLTSFREFLKDLKSNAKPLLLIHPTTGVKYDISWLLHIDVADRHGHPNYPPNTAAGQLLRENLPELAYTLPEDKSREYKGKFQGHGGGQAYFHSILSD